MDYGACMAVDADSMSFVIGTNDLSEQSQQHCIGNVHE
jgi:hypothetical protein